MTKSTLKINAGTLMQLQFESRGEERLNSRVIGWIPGISILVTTPKQEDRVILVRNKQKVTVRFVNDTSACAFESEVRNVCTHPVPYLHLAYPQEIEIDEVRKARRIQVSIEAILTNPAGPPGERYKGVINDLSQSGARIISEPKLGKPGDAIALRSTLEIPPLKRMLRTEGIIRSRTLNINDVDTYIYGIEFTKVAEEDLLLLIAFVTTQTLSSLENKS
jgi:c-di-GMP-binding flagellar brake protein YcgR